VTRLLEVEDLSVTFRTDDGDVRAVRGLSFSIDEGETLAVVGESGSGKTVAALAIMRLLPRSARVEGTIRFRGTSLLDLDDEGMRRLQGDDLAMVFQDPMTALNPVLTVGAQIVEAIRIHRDVTEAAARDRAAELLDLVGIPEARRRVDSYPHEFSGGMRQRAMIAMAIANEPKLLIADEPTTALDVTVQAQVMEVIRRVQDATGTAVMLVTHDLGLVAGTADRIQVMYGGRLLESGDTDTIFYASRNPYTLGLMASIPSAVGRTARRLDPIPGSPPSLIDLPLGCVFGPRCAYVAEACRIEPDLVVVDDATGHATRCHRAPELPALMAERERERERAGTGSGGVA
jgi:peptide/nickel transport system ATP-binding protein